MAACVAVALLIFGYTAFSSSSLPAYLILKRKHRDLSVRVALLQEKKMQQQEKVQLLSGTTPESHARLKQIARREYGFVGNEETILILH